MAVFRTPISCIAMYLALVSASTSPWEWIQQVWCFPDSVLCLYYAAMPTVQLFEHLDFQRNITAGTFWMLSILRIMRGENLKFTDTQNKTGWRVRGVELIPSYFWGEPRSRTPMLGFWKSTLHCPKKFVISRYSWKPPHWYSIVPRLMWLLLCSRKTVITSWVLCQLGGAKLSRCCWQHFSCHLVTLSPPSIDSSVTSFHPRLNNLYIGAPDNHCAAAEGRMQQVGHICLTLQRGA